MIKIFIFIIWSLFKVEHGVDASQLYFQEEPPYKADFSNTVGAKIRCEAGGEAGQPTVTWILSDGSLAKNIPGLREVQNNGDLVFNSFRPENFRLDVHSTVYRCLASNSFGKIISREVQVNGVVTQALDIKVYDVYVIEKNVAVLRCHIPSVLKRHFKVVGWIKNDNLYIQSTPQDSSNDKYMVMPNGELHIFDVTVADSGAKYKCKAENSLTGVTQMSSNAGQLFITESGGLVPPKFVEMDNNVAARQGILAVLPCVAQGNPVPRLKWYKKHSSRKVLLKTDDRLSITKNALLIRNVQINDDGIYSCVVENTLNDLQRDLNLTVTIPLTVTVNPFRYDAKMDEKTIFTCETEGQPITTTTWYHNGKVINTVTAKNLIINNVREDDRGIYQCMVKNEEEMIQSSTELHMSEMTPRLLEAFGEVALKPGSSVNVKCVATGVPVPTIQWRKYGETIDNNHRIKVDFRYENEHVISILTINNLAVEDGGLYSCKVSNKAGYIKHESRINVYGELGMHTVAQVMAVSDALLILNCPYYGYPVDSVKWRKDDRLLPDNIRQTIFKNGTLVAENIDKIIDAGQYKCTVTDKQGDKKEGSLDVRILVPPKIVPFEFQDELLREGMRARLQCVISEGDLPLTVEWLKDGANIANEQGILVKVLDEFSSILTINSITPKHNGKYTCVASNDAATVIHSAQLSVNVPPKVIPFSFLDDQFYKGMRSLVTCAVSQGDLPVSFEWLKDGKPIPSNIGIATRKYDENTDSLSIENVDSRHSGNYTCIASNQAGKAVHTAQLMVRVRPKIVPFQFGDLHYEGSPARVVCGLQEGDAPIQFSWLHDDKPLMRDNSVVIHEMDGISSILSIVKLKASHAGIFKCIARNGAGVDRHNAVLRVNVPPKIVPFEFKEEQLVEGLMARVSCIISRGDLPLNFIWEKNGVVIEPGNQGTQIRSFDEHSSILSIPSVSPKHNGLYTCITKNDAGMARHSAKLVVKVPPRWKQIPNDLSVLRDNSAMIHCSVEGFPQPKISWKQSKDENDPKSVTELQSSNNIRLFQNGSLFIRHMTADVEGFYFCIASNGIGKGLSAKVKLTINAPPQFKATPKIIHVGHGSNADVQCFIEGESPINVTWYKDDKLIQPKSASEKIQTAGTSDAVSTLTIFKVSRSSNGNYTCKAENKYGSNHTAIQLLVIESPDPPTHLKVESVGTKNVEISWTPSFDGNERIKKFIIQCKETVANWENAVMLETVNGVPTNSIINQLRPSTSYLIRVFAENSHGRSLPSQILRATTEEDVPSAAPLNVQVEPINTETFKVTWKAPLEESWNGKLLGFNIGYKEVDTADPFLFKTLVTTEPKASDLFVHIGSLKQFTKYAVIVQSYNSKGKGPLSEEVIVMTSEGAPTVSPLDVRCTVLTSQSIHITWSAVPTEAMNGILRGYKVLYKPAMDWLDFADHFNTSLLNSLTLNQLDKFTNYSVQVQAMTKAGHGPKSEPIFCKTLDDVPASPADIKVIATSEDSVIVAWKAPDSPNGVIKSYTIYWKEFSNQKAATQQQTVSSHTNHYEVTQLKKGVRYDFWLTASTMAGQGEASRTMSQTPRGPTVPAKVVSFDSKITIPWKSDIRLPCMAVGTPEPSRIWSSKGKNIETMEAVIIRDDGSLTINEIQESDAGDYVCSVRNDFGEDKIAHTVTVLGPPASPVFDVTSISTDALEIQWKAPASKNFRIKGYTLHIRKDGGVWKDVTISSDARSYRVNSLDCGTRYELYMSAYNKIGIGASSPSHMLSTNGSVPISPLMSDLIEETSNSVSLYLNTWKSNGCTIQYFMVEYAPKASNQWTTVSTNVKPEQRRLVIPNLKSGTWYKLRMTAHNSAGSSVSKYDFATLTLNGATISPDLQADVATDEGINGLMATLNFYVIVPITCTIVILIAIFGLACLCVNLKKREILARREAANRMSTMTDYYQVGNPDVVSYMQAATMSRQSVGSKRMNEMDEIAPYATLPLHREYRSGAPNAGDGPDVFNRQFIIPHGFVSGPGPMESTFIFPDPPPDVGFQPTSLNRGYENDQK